MTAFPAAPRRAGPPVLLVFASPCRSSRALYRPTRAATPMWRCRWMESGDWLHPQLAPGVPHYTRRR